jgi:SAM-dependent methyltransferase
VPIATYLFVAGLGSYVVARGDLPITRTLAAGLVSGVLITGATDREPLLRTRSLFSSYRVSNEDGIVTLRNGTTVHGAGRFEETGHPVPTAYYHPTSPIAQAIASARARKGSVSVATVGLGAGTMACLRADGERWRYFEIDPVVVDIARNPALFHFIDRCDPRADIVVGDARLTLDDDPDARWDVLVLDAFSSDAIPTHLLTQEAMRLYKAALAPDGLIVIHISNREFDLRGPIQATAATLGLKAIQRTDQVEKQFPIVLRSRVAVLSASDEALAPLSAEGWTPILPGRPIDPWTDDHTNLMVALFHD